MLLVELGNLRWLLDDVLICVIAQFRQLSWAIKALIVSYYQQFRGSSLFLTLARVESSLETTRARTFKKMENLKAKLRVETNRPMSLSSGSSFLIDDILVQKPKVSLIDSCCYKDKVDNPKLLVSIYFDYKCISSDSIQVKDQTVVRSRCHRAEILFPNPLTPQLRTLSDLFRRVLLLLNRFEYEVPQESKTRNWYILRSATL